MVSHFDAICLCYVRNLTAFNPFAVHHATLTVAQTLMFALNTKVRALLRTISTVSTFAYALVLADPRQASPRSIGRRV